MGGALRPPFSAKLFRTVADRVGRRAELADERLLQHKALKPAGRDERQRLNVLTDGSMLPATGGRWKEAKVGVLLRDQDRLSRLDANRNVVARARYTAVWDGQEELKEVMRAALDVERWQSYAEVVWLGDGARCIWNMAEVLCPTAIQILDIGHAIENGMKCGKALLGESHPLLELWEKRLRSLVDAGNTNATIHELMDCMLVATDDELEPIDDLVRYYRHNAERMKYPEFLAKGLMIGSGVVESAHRHVLQSRMKRSGQHWSEEHGRRMVKLRYLYRTAGADRFYDAINRAAVGTAALGDRKLRLVA